MVLAACHGARYGRRVWVDVFAVRQWPGKEFRDLHFRETINRCKGLLVAMAPMDQLYKFIDEQSKLDIFFNGETYQKTKSRIPIFRLWCNVETAHAVIHRKPVVVKCGKAIRVNNNEWKFETGGNGAQLENLINIGVNVEKSECYNDSDREREMSIIRATEGGSKDVNRVITGVLIGSAWSTIHRRLEVDSATFGEFESLNALKITITPGSYEE
jgi:hypothetical protein